MIGVIKLGSGRPLHGWPSTRKKTCIYHVFPGRVLGHVSMNCCQTFKRMKSVLLSFLRMCFYLCQLLVENKQIKKSSTHFISVAWNVLQVGNFELVFLGSACDQYALYTAIFSIKMTSKTSGFLWYKVECIWSWCDGTRSSFTETVLNF